MLYPNKIYNKIEDINIEELIKEGIQAVILDVDNTLVDKSNVLSIEKQQWVNNAKSAGIKLCVLSNTFKKQKVEAICEKLDIPYFMRAIKPLKKGYKKCVKLFNMLPSQICIVGDQIFTDVLGGNRMGMYTIYVYPISLKDCSITTAIKRPLERLIVNKYLQRKGERNGDI